MNKKIFIYIFFCFLTNFLFAELSKEDFITQTRKNLLRHSWIKMSGDLYFRSQEDEINQKKIEIKTQLFYQNLTFQVSINNNEKVRFFQKFSTIYEAYDLFNNLKENNSFLTMGLNIADLSLSFMYWDLIKELDSSRVGLLSCRVFLMRNPDNINFARVYISAKYFAPLRVEWLIDLQKDPYQYLEFKSFTEKNKIWVPQKNPPI